MFKWKNTKSYCFVKLSRCKYSASVYNFKSKFITIFSAGAKRKSDSSTSQKKKKAKVK